MNFKLAIFFLSKVGNTVFAAFCSLSISRFPFPVVGGYWPNKSIRSKLDPSQLNLLLTIIAVVIEAIARDRWVSDHHFSGVQDQFGLSVRDYLSSKLIFLPCFVRLENSIIIWLLETQIYYTKLAKIGMFLILLHS